MRLEDMRLFAKVAEAQSFTAAARELGVPKQTVSRRIAELERALDVQLLHRTTRALRLTDVGAAYAERCAAIIRLADEANRAVTDARQIPRGLLRVTADPVFGEAFVSELVVDYMRRWPEVRTEVVFTRRHVDLVEEGFDIAFRIGKLEKTALSTIKLGPARVHYCASPDYLTRHGTPRRPEELVKHECIVVSSDPTSVRWPFRGARGELLVPVSGRLTVNSFAVARAAALAGLGIAIFPEFACTEDIRCRRLITVLGDYVGEVGAVWLVHKTSRYLTPRVRMFVDLAVSRLGNQRWVVASEDRLDVVQD